MGTKPVAAYTDIVDTDPEEGIKLLHDAGFEVQVVGSADPHIIAQTAGRAEALLIGYSPVTEKLLDSLPALRIVATQSAGVDMVDVEACRRRGIAVANLPASATEEVASHALALSLALVRGLHVFDRATHAGTWEIDAFPLSRPSSLTVGILGLGRIGRTYASYARNIFGRVVGYDPAEFAVEGVERMQLAEVLQASNLVSLHLPLTASSRHLLNHSTLSMLPDGARIINVSRGELIDAQALRVALDEGRVAAAGLDVFAVEPATREDPLWQHPKVLATPHAAFLSDQSLRDYVVHQAENVISFFRTGKPVSPYES